MSFSTTQHLYLDISLEKRVVVRVSSATGRLKAVHVVTPPRTSSPPGNTLPNIRVLLEIVQHVLNSSLAGLVRTAGEFTDHADLLVLPQPLSSSLDALDSNGGGDTVG